MAFRVVRSYMIDGTRKVKI